MTEELSTEAEAVAQLAREGLTPILLDPKILYHVVTPEGSTRDVLDLEKFLPKPNRKRGTTNLHTQDAFALFVKEHAVDHVSHLYANREGFSFTAVFNDASNEDTGWGDHRAVLTLKKSPEWLHWESKDGQLISQEAFAEHVELGLEEIEEPDGATMLELATTFQAHTGVEFRQATVLRSGERQFSYIENTSDTAGRSGDISFPRELKLVVSPFEGTQPYRVTASVRYRLSSGKLTLGYQLIRPYTVLQDSFDIASNWISTDTGLTALRGAPRSI